MQNDITIKDYLQISFLGLMIAHSGFVYYLNKNGQFKVELSLVPLASVASITAGSYCYATNTNPQPLQKTVMYGFLCGNILYSLYDMYKHQHDYLTLVSLVQILIGNSIRYWNITNGISSLIEKFATDQVKIPIGNTDIPVTGGATTIGVQWSSTDDPATDTNLTGDAEPESTT